MIKLTAWLCLELPRARGVFFRFADWHAFVPALLCRFMRKKLWIVLAGYDSHHIPDYRYGVYTSRLRAFVVRYAVRHATALLPVHESLYDGVNTYAFDPPRSIGVKSLVPGIRGDVLTVYNGFDARFWCADPVVQKERIVVTVASVPQKVLETARRRMACLKGVPLLFEIARRMPDVRFIVIGPENGTVTDEDGTTPANVTLTGHLTAEDVRTWYRRAKVYAHPSLTEGMPNAVAEAMLCECVPVGSNVNGTATLIGDAGFVIDYPDPERWIAAIRFAFDSDLGRAARDRIVVQFSVAKRCARLREIVAADR
jgi:glycosyltransferase involved in cell wall biosynthesis